MADPEDLLGALPEESPPPEIVLAAVRVFRYRAVAVAAITIVLVMVGAYFVQKQRDDSQFLVEVGRALATGGVYSPDVIGEMRRIDGTRLSVWGIVGDAGPDPSTFYVHLVGWGAGTGNTNLEIRDPRYGGAPTAITGEQYLGGFEDGKVSYDIWFGVEAPGAFGTLAFDAEIVRYRDDGTRAVLATVPFEFEV